MPTKWIMRRMALMAIFFFAFYLGVRIAKWRTRNVNCDQWSSGLWQAKVDTRIHHVTKYASNIVTKGHPQRGKHKLYFKKIPTRHVILAFTETRHQIWKHLCLRDAFLAVAFLVAYRGDIIRISNCQTRVHLRDEGQQASDGHILKKASGWLQNNNLFRNLFYFVFSFLMLIVY